MRKLILAAALAAFASPILAEGLEMGLALGTTEDTVRAALTEMGYEVRKFDMEDGMMEVYAVKGSEMAEIYIDVNTGAIVKVGGNG